MRVYALAPSKPAIPDGQRNVGHSKTQYHVLERKLTGLDKDLRRTNLTASQRRAKSDLREKALANIMAHASVMADWYRNKA